MSKSPAFQWYAADYLADERVMLLSLESEAAYVRLLSLCWREGSIPAKPELCAPLCKYADVKVIKPALALFMKSPGQPGRLIHKRLEEERAKQESFRAKQAQHGKKGGRPRKEDEKPEKPNPLASLSQPLPEPKPSLSPRMPSSLSSSSTSISSNDDSAQEPPSSGEEVQPLEAQLTAQPKLAVPAADPAKAAALASTDPSDEQHWSVGPLTKPVPFKVICERLGHLGIDFEYYRRVALVAAEDKNDSRTIIQWTSWVRNFFTNQLKKGPLLKPTDGEAARTGVNAPQYEGGYQHEVKPEIKAQREAEQQQQRLNRMVANLAKHEAAAGITQQPPPGAAAGIIGA